MSALSTVTFEGVPAGSNLASPPHEIADNQARYIQDALLDQLGLLRNRGPIKATTGVATFADAGVGIAQTITPGGIHKVGVLHGGGSFGVLSDDYSTVTTDLTWPVALTTAPYSIVDAKPALGGGALVGTASQYATGATKALAYWRGGDKPDYTTGTVTATRGSTSVTGSGTTWGANVHPGMFLFATSTDPAGVSCYVGVVQSVNSDTSLTLESAALFPASGGAYKLTSLRGLIPHYRGRMTTQTTTTAGVGASTKFVANSLGTGTWYIFRASDNAFVGKVASVQGDTTLTLAANATVALTVDEFVAYRADAAYSIGTPTLGMLTAVYAERQWYADGIDVWFSEADDFEAIDRDPIAGNYVEVSSTKIGAASRPTTCIAPAYNALLITKENESFALIGQTPDQFELRKLNDDGALSSMSVQVYDGNVIYAGREGIYAFDGQQVTNIVEDRLGSYYKEMMATFDPTTYRMWSAMAKDHYTLFIEAVTPSYGPHKGNVIENVARMTVTIYLPTRAVVFQTNLDIRGSIELPAYTGRGVWYLVNTASGARIGAFNELFTANGNDVLTCVGNTAGPDFYIESKRYSMGDDLRKKLFKQLELHYFVGGDNLKLDTVLGLNDNGTTSVTQWIKTLLAWDNLPPVATTWDSLVTQYKSWDDLGQPRFAVKRIKFLKRSQHLGFRIYQNSSNVTQIKLGPWQIGYKLQRAGRI